MKNISIVGDGAMGSVCAMMLCQKHYAVRMWGYDAKQLGEIQNRKENFKFLPGYKLPDELAFESRDSEILKNADLIVSAVPCQYMRSVFARLKSHFNPAVPIVSVTKGVENGTLLRPSQILADVLGGDVKVIALSGPTIADELVRKLPATATAACQDEQLAKVVQDIFTMPYFRIYRNTDIIGVELAGAMKNVIAIAAGIVDGIKVGDNAKAALLCRGLAEITRLGLSLGAKEQTFFGLSGLGDLVTTCISPLGRNRIFGQRIGTGQSVKEALGATMSVVEGAATCKSIVELAKTRNIDMPITESVYQILFCGKGVLEAIEELMKRKLKAE
ncbi:MAG TPA: glycerol-3-phosphate dehydrogenase [Phycisphaerales bacterium]|nr:MAG: glycerol-3-phosphate dehydrogenase [Planctomycetes bacterium GWC2_45_44]HBG77581.1 glycerol-3-phosphate dehydrogenase [Phycisphaerales bacterium]HBR20344.1 glycerol-3-phosphate dehydrogenase [Phycisphaerales bacterium]